MLFPETQEDKNDNYNRFLLTKDFANVYSLSKYFARKYPENYFYRPLQVEIEIT